MPPVGFEPTISTGEGPRTYALDRAATGTGLIMYIASGNGQQWTGSEVCSHNYRKILRSMKNLRNIFHKMCSIYGYKFRSHCISNPQTFAQLSTTFCSIVSARYCHPITTETKCTKTFSVILQNIRFIECPSSCYVQIADINGEAIRRPFTLDSPHPQRHPSAIKHVQNTPVLTVTEAPASVSFAASLYQVPLCVTSPICDTQRRCTVWLPPFTSSPSSDAARRLTWLQQKRACVTK